MVESPSTLVLVGGSGLGGWVWERVVPLLERRGHRVVTPHLRGIDGDPTPAAEVTLSDWADDLAAAVEGEADGQGGKGVTVVAHSFAAYVTAGALVRLSTSGRTPARAVAPPVTSERTPARPSTPLTTSAHAPAPRTSAVRAVVMVDAVLPSPGRSWFDQQRPGAAEVMPLLAVDGATPWFTRQEIDALFPGHGLTDADHAWMASRVSGQPLGTYAEPAPDFELADSGVALGYVRCLRTDPPTSSVTASTPGWSYREIDAGHWPMVTAPEETAAVLDELARSLTGVSGGGPTPGR
ncbi:alpha/beta hydrolase [Georgenia sp. Z1491]|uniref:alpha/beta hydrolase n=1 Tax=Georgenia sp. Z1491 TaxID=3416707 RepID=UPI003CFA17E1